jgi:uncharacterized membrane protein
MGQIYQTGADSELLFAGWAALTLPWVLAGRAPWLWLFWLLLVNVALGLFMSGRVSLFSSGMDVSLLLNAAALCAWELLWPRINWLRAPYAPRAIALLTALCATALGVAWWFDRRDQVIPYTPLLYLVWLGATLWFYHRQRRDIVPLAAAALSFIVVATAGLIHGLLDLGTHDDIVSSLLIIGLTVAVLTALAAAWLRRTVAAWQTQVPNTTQEDQA